MSTRGDFRRESDDQEMSDAWPVRTLTEIETELCAPGNRFELEEISLNGIPCLSWKNQHRNLAELARSAAAQFADRDMLIYEHERVTYAAWFKAVAHLAQQLRDQSVRKGDRIALAARNYPEWPVVFFAIVSVGAIAVPFNAWWTGDELRGGLQQSGARMLICDAERWNHLKPHLENLDSLDQIIVCRTEGDLPDGVTRLEEIIGTSADWAALPKRDLPDIDLASDDDATILYTSGTTGFPKGALASHRANLSYILGAAYAAERASLRRGQAPPPADAPRVLLSPVPFFHVTGLNAYLLPLIDAGSAYVLMHKWDAGKALELIERERVTIVGGVPTVAWQLLEHPERGQHDLSSLEVVAYGGAPAAPELAPRIASELNAVAHNGWGMTETCGVGSRHGDEDYRNRPNSCGPANPGTEFRIADPESGVALAADEVGELWVRGAHIIKGYWNNPGATAEAIQDGWFRTGDLARIDADGFCYIVGRAKDVIIRGGENIYPIEIENALFHHPAVIDAAVVGISHRTLGEEPAAVVHLAEGAHATEDELKQWLARYLAAFKQPVRIVFLDDMLPRNANGKILKRELRTMLEEA